MPLAKLTSCGESVELWFDVFGEGATSSENPENSKAASDLRDAAGKSLQLPSRSSTVSRRQGVAAGLAASVICSCLPLPTSKVATRRPIATNTSTENMYSAQSCETTLDMDNSKPAAETVLAPRPVSKSSPDSESETQRGRGCTKQVQVLQKASNQQSVCTHQESSETSDPQLKSDLSAPAPTAGQIPPHSMQICDAPESASTVSMSNSERSRTECKGRIPSCASKVLFIAGLSARGRTEFFQHVVKHLASLRDSLGNHLLSVCTFDNRGIGRSTIPKQRRKYSTSIMAHDTLALLNHLEWQKVHIVGLSLGGMIASKLAAMQPDRIASLTLIATTVTGWQMLLGISTNPLLATLAGSGPLRWKIPANLRYNFSSEYLKERVHGDLTRMQVLIENTYQAIEEKDTEKFLAEGQPSIGRQAHLAAVGKHRMTSQELRVIRDAPFPCQVIVGRHDRLARAYYVHQMAKQLRCPLLVVEAAHAGIMIEALPVMVYQLESIILGGARSSKLEIQQLGKETNRTALESRLYAKEFATTFGPGRISLNAKSAGQSGLKRSKTIAV